VTVQTIDAAAIPGPAPAALLGPLTTLTAGTRLLGMSRDRRAVYGRSTAASPGDRTLRVSLDDGDTWTDLRTFAFAIEGMVELDDGEALVVCQGGTATPGYVYRSTGWATDRATATWEQVLTTRAGYIRSVWGMHRWSHTGPVVVTGEYGSQTPASGSPAAAATRVYLSENSGRSWRVVLDLAVAYPGVPNLHVHGTGYDSASDRLWVTYGDAIAHLPAGTALLMFSDDRGQTWQHVTKPTAWSPSAAGGFQTTPIAFTEAGVVTLPDGVPYGAALQARRGFRDYGPLTLGATWAGNTGAQGIAYCLHRPDGPGPRPLWATTQGASALVPALLLVDPTGTGTAFVEVFRDTTNNTSTIHHVVGPTAAGNVLVALANTLRRGRWAPPA